jgi:hypothetical protein
MLNFSDALHELKSGNRVHRTGWNSPNTWLCLQVPDAHSKMTLPYIYLRTDTGHLIPWFVNQIDLLANDWDVLQNVVNVTREQIENARNVQRADPEDE